VRLLDLLQQRFPDSSKTTLRKMLEADRVRVNGAVARDAKAEVSSDDVVDVVSRKRAVDPRVEILHEDDDVLVINKAAGLLTVATEHGDDEETAESLLNRYTRALHVHRLDRETSGVLVFARNAWARDRLQEQFAGHDIERVYIAIAHGRLEPSSGTFRSQLVDEGRVRSAPGGKLAITHYRTLSFDGRDSLLELTLETGRRNQIRVHLAEAGHPVAGDAIYGVADGWARLALHATRLGFTHPRSGKMMRFEVRAPFWSAAAAPPL
jgi:23S rRNA pseudouridine1911/1915/1917 synthase